MAEHQALTDSLNAMYTLGSSHSVSTGAAHAAGAALAQSTSATGADAKDKDGAPGSASADNAAGSALSSGSETILHRANVSQC